MEWLRRGAIQAHHFKGDERSLSPPIYNPPLHDIPKLSGPPLLHQVDMARRRRKITLVLCSETQNQWSKS
jgi:hypothetical protein